jgi:hypothetical protein
MAGDRSDWWLRERIRWRLARKPLRLATQGGGVALPALGTFIFLRNSGQVNETAASVLVAVVFGVVTVLQQRQAQRRQHTVGLITAFQTADRLCAADVWMGSRISRRIPVDADVPAADEPHVITMLDYYEFLAVLALRGVVDTRLLVNLRGGTMSRCFRLCRDYVDDRRQRSGRELYQALEAFTDEYVRRSGPWPPAEPTPPAEPIAPAAPNPAVGPTPPTVPEQPAGRAESDRVAP